MIAKLKRVCHAPVTRTHIFARHGLWGEYVHLKYLHSVSTMFWEGVYAKSFAYNLLT